MTDGSLQITGGLFLTPFRGQVDAVASLLAERGISGWTASTVHCQQGGEADVVIFDTVHASSTAWPYDEWKRLVNVAISRARQQLILLASRAEMDAPYLRPLSVSLSPRFLRGRGGRLVWHTPPEATQSPTTHAIAEANSGYHFGERHRLGDQIESRHRLSLVLSAEQQRLCDLTLDGRPRLVRGVAGSGKTVVLARWLTQTLAKTADRPDHCIWVVFANRSLQSMIDNAIEQTWQQIHPGKSLPLDRVQLHHVREVLNAMLPEVGLQLETFGFDYDAAAKAYLSQRGSTNLPPRCDALFIDEGQDMGPGTLQLLSSLVRQFDPADANSRNVNIFYDNAQNLYGRGTPRWSQMGLDMRGRSTVMTESFRGTRPIVETAQNVLYRLQPPGNDPDHKEAVDRGLIEPTIDGEQTWWRVHFNQVEGPRPRFRCFPTWQRQATAIAEDLRRLIVNQKVQPSTSRSFTTVSRSEIGCSGICVNP